MVGTVLTALWVVFVLWLVPFVHQLGHYYTGRRIVGVPGSEIRLMSTLFPRQVVLRDGETWVGPSSFQQFRAAYESHDASYEQFERYVAGGELIQGLLVVPTAIVLALGGFERLSAILLTVSLLTTSAYVVRDAVRTQQSDSPAGDYSALWKISPRIPAVFLLGFFCLHVASFYFVL